MPRARRSKAARWGWFLPLAGLLLPVACGGQTAPSGTGQDIEGTGGTGGAGGTGGSSGASAGRDGRQGGGASAGWGAGNTPNVGGAGGSGVDPLPGGAAGSKPLPPDDTPVEPPPGPDATPLARLEWLQKTIVGSWSGKLQTPWADAYDVALRFHQDGRYEAYSSGPMAALYYGADGSQPEKTYWLDDIGLALTATGTITVVFEGGGVTTTTTDEIEDLTITPDGGSLSFDVIHLKQSGPLHYELTRVSPL